MAAAASAAAASARGPVEARGAEASTWERGAGCETLVRGSARPQRGCWPGGDGTAGSEDGRFLELRTAGVTAAGRVGIGLRTMPKEARRDRTPAPFLATRRTARMEAWHSSRRRRRLFSSLKRIIFRNFNTLEQRRGTARCARPGGRLRDPLASSRRKSLLPRLFQRPAHSQDNPVAL